MNRQRQYDLRLSNPENPEPGAWDLSIWLLRCAFVPFYRPPVKPGG
jgi:hypothetical protein